MLGLVRHGDGAGDAGQFAVKHGADVADLIRQATARQELGGQHFGRLVGDDRRLRQKTTDFLGQGTVRVADVVQSSKFSGVGHTPAFSISPMTLRAKA